MRFLATALFLLVAASCAVGDVIPSVTLPQGSGNLMYFDLTVWSVSDPGSSSASGFGARAILSGSDAARFTGYADLLDNLTGGETAALLSPGTYAWEPFGSPNVADAGIDSGHPWMSFGAQSSGAPDMVPMSSLQPGMILARFYFVDSNPGAPLTDLYLQIHGYNDVTPYAYITLQDSVTEVQVWVNSGDPVLLVPEPATLALLAVGLPLLLRRRRS
ncbi:MAG: PEP-CTERM sorting domain-containing protein [Planctomycetes bacterium]|nr:PEP-CTERM sorting domain-containing protein [Planctomycetota bacterium]